MFSQLGALLEFTSLDIQAAFVDQMRIAISGMAVWEDLETLVYETLHISGMFRTLS